MKKVVATYDEFISEGADASVFNTPGMGNVTVSTDRSTIQADGEPDTAEQDRVAQHLKMHERSHRGDDWMKPSGDYKNRNWLVPNYETYQNERQSNTRFQVGQEVRCIDPMKECYGMVGKIVAFEDNTIRWEAHNSATGVGQGAKQYRCHAAQLELVG